VSKLGRFLARVVYIMLANNPHVISAPGFSNNFLLNIENLASWEHNISTSHFVLK